MLNLELSQAQLNHIQDAVFKKYKQRLIAQGVKLNSAEARKLATEYVVGIVATLDYLRGTDEISVATSSISPRLFFAIQLGEITDILNQ